MFFAKKSFGKTSTRIVKYESQVVKSNPVPAIANYYAHQCMSLPPPLTPKMPHDMSYLLDACQIGQAQKKFKNLRPSGK